MPRPTRRQLLEATAAVTLLGGASACGGRPATDLRGRPIIYFFIDQLRADALGCTGNPVVQSPNIDAIAREGVLFERCVTNGPSCRAARATMMTGLQVVDHGVFDNKIMPRPSLQSHVRQLRDVGGYHTMVVGKTHLHDGFGHLGDHVDRLVEWGFSDAVELPDPQQHRLGSAHSDWLTATTPKGQEDKFARWGRYIQQYVWDAPPPDLAPFFLSTEDHLDSFCARTAADVVRTYQGDAPLYLQVNFPGPHKPFDPTSEFTALYDGADPAFPWPILEPPAEPVSPLNELYQGIKLEDWTQQTARALQIAYYGKVTLVDRGVGIVLDALREAGLYDDAWIVVHSDHGELLADHMMTGKVLSYESAIRTPLIIKPPGGVEPWTDRGQVDLMDVVASILGMAGLDPSGFGDDDLVDRVLEGSDGPRAHGTKTVLFENLGHVGLRRDDIKLGWDLELGRPVELFDLAADPQERSNVVADQGRRALLDELVDDLRSRRTLPRDNHN